VKECVERYDLVHDRAIPEIPNIDDRRLVKMVWSIVSKAADMSKRHKEGTC